MARPRVDTETAERLKAMADQEMAATRDRLAKRTAAASAFAGAVSMLDEAQATWQRVQEETSTVKASAVGELLEAGMKPAEVAELLGIDAKELRSIRAASSAAEGGEAAPTGTAKSPSEVEEQAEAAAS